MELYQPNVELYHFKSSAEREEKYRESIDDPDTFWGTFARENFHWEEPFTQVRDINMDCRNGPISIKWFLNGKTNLCYNSVDRHILAGKGDRIAYYFEGNEVSEESKITYKELHEEVQKFANVLLKHGVVKGTRVTVYMPMIIALPVVILACARIGAVLNVVFAGFSAHALSQRIADCASEIIVTADSVYRGAKAINLKEIVDHAIDFAEKEGTIVSRCIVYERHGRKVDMKGGRDFWYQDEMKDAQLDSKVEWLDSEDPCFLLYTSGSTGKPKGVLHTVGGYMVYTSITFRYSFDYHESDIYWCTADIGWITGHSYIVFGPLLNAATSVLFEGVPTHPDAGRCWAVVDKYQVTIFYTAPTAIRALQKFGNDIVQKYSRKSLRILGTVGEPINVEAWKWYYDVVGGGRCVIVDTWWQTETGGHMITPFPCNPTKPGSASFPFFGVSPLLLGEKGDVLEGENEGILVLASVTPGMCRTIYGDHERFEQTYYKCYPGYYFTGDGARRDKDGYYWLTGRVDDVINVSGHRLGTAEIENALNTNPVVVESAVVGFPHNIKGTGIYAYVVVRDGVEFNESVRNSIRNTVREEIGPIATPDVIQWACGLPKTRSGKIMRRILRKIASDELENMGDTSTLADPSVVQKLIDGRERH